jgi:benzoate membrane transport protein
MLERPALAPPGLRQIISDFNPAVAANGLIGFIFSATGPVAIILSVGTQGGLSEAQMASWIFGAFAICGLISILMCWLYRQPLVCLWTIPGAVLVGPALGHLTFPQVLCAFYATGVLILVLGLSGWVRRAVATIPMPIVMGMVAGVFLRFGLDLVRSLREDIVIAGPMVAVWLVLSGLPELGRRIPPILGALVVGVVVMIACGRTDGAALASTSMLAHPLLQAPVWSWPAIIELTVPLAISVLVVQNGQGIAVLKSVGHEPPVDAISVTCGIGSLLCAMVGCVSTCLTGPTNAIIVASGKRSDHYVGGIVTGLLALAFGLMAPAFTRLLLHTPKTFIMALAGLAMLRVLQGAFAASFKTRFSLGALVAFLVTVADIDIANIGAAFWGLVAGFAASWLMERHDFHAVAAERAGG